MIMILITLLKTREGRNPICANGMGPEPYGLSFPAVRRYYPVAMHIT